MSAVTLCILIRFLQHSHTRKLFKTRGRTYSHMYVNLQYNAYMLQNLTEAKISLIKSTRHRQQCTCQNILNKTLSSLSTCTNVMCLALLRRYTFVVKLLLS